MIKKIRSITADFLLAVCIAFLAKYLIEWLSACDQVTSSHLSVMTASGFFVIRKYPLRDFLAKKGYS